MSTELDVMAHTLRALDEQPKRCRENDLERCHFCQARDQHGSFRTDRLFGREIVICEECWVAGC